MKTTTKTKNLVVLFIANFSILFVGMGLFPILPLYASQYGASPTEVGIYLAITYIAITLGSLTAGWLIGRVSGRVAMLSAGALGAPAVFLLGQASTLWQVMALTAVIWFTGGVGLSSISMFAAASAEANERGKWFGLISLTNPLGAILGSMAVGYLVEQHGYGVMHTWLAAEYALWPVMALLIQGKITVEKTLAKPSQSGVAISGKPIFLLMSAALLTAFTVSVARMGLSLEMKAQNFSASEISNANVIGGVVTIPIILSMGMLSDRLGRRLFLIVGMMVSASSAVLLGVANHLWQFWMISAAVLAARSINPSLASALAVDILAPGALNKGLARLNAINWIAGIIGFAGAGYLMENLGTAALFHMAAGASFSAAALVGMMFLIKKQTVSKPALTPAPCA
jgi:DHA1 family multidrug resistance protein-like MFS transporter